MTEGDKAYGKAGEGGKAAALIKTIEDINLSLKDIHIKIASVSLSNNEILENVGKRFEELLGVLSKEKEGNEKFVSEIGNLKENFKGYDDILNKFLTDVTSKIEEGVDKSYDVVNGCVTVVETLKGDFETVRTSAENAFKNAEGIQKDSIEIQNHIYTELQQAHKNIMELISGFTEGYERANAESLKISNEIKGEQKNLEDKVVRALTPFGNLGKELEKLDEHIPALYRGMEALSVLMKNSTKLIHEDKDRYFKVLEESKNALKGIGNFANELERIVKEQEIRSQAIVSAADKLTDYVKDLSDSGNQVTGIHKALAEAIKNKYAEEANERKESRKSIARWIKGGVAGASACLLLLIGAYGLKGCESEKIVCSNRDNVQICYRMADKGIIYVRASNKDGLTDEIVARSGEDGVLYRIERNSDAGKRNYKLFEKADGILKGKR